MEFRVLGPLEVRDDGASVTVGGAKLRALLALLALHPNRPISAERLAAAIWGDDVAPKAVKAIQVYVSRLRKALGDATMLETTAAGYRLVIERDELDAECFVREVASGRKALVAGDAERAADLLRGALDLWRGPPLEEFAWAPFSAPEIERLEELRLGALESLVDAELAAGRHAELVADLQHLTRAHPWRERLHTQLMLALYRSGRQADALDAYQRARRMLVEQLGIEPGAELHDVHQAILAHDAALNAAPRAAAPRRRGNVPAPPNRTIGRADELRATVARLRARNVRVLTFTGPGGVGKTRLALEAARAIEDDFADGAWFVSLAAVERAQDVAAAIVSALGIVPLAGESSEHAVERFIGTKHLLMVVDNCEHLPEAAPFIGGLPAIAAGVTVLATSREPLAVQAEQLHPVPPLALPEASTSADAGALERVEAVALFCERAQAHDPAFGLREDNAGAVATICRRLDGLPLAIELAAARCALLSPGEIATRLSDAVSTLRGGPRDAPARQQTLRATLDWSHGLLDDNEQACFAGFAVFAGGATVEAAETITGAELDTLDRLVAKSLLVRGWDARGQTRLSMLETVRAYALDRFEALPEREVVRERHFAYFLVGARTHGSDRAVMGRNRREHLAWMDVEVENLRAALRWATEREATEEVVALGAGLVDYWMQRDRYAEAVDWLLPALRRLDAAADPTLRAVASFKVCWPLWALGRDDEVLAMVPGIEAMASSVTDLEVRADVLLDCAALCGVTGHPERGRRTAEEAMACAKASGDAWRIATAAWARAVVAIGFDEFRERVDEAVSLMDDAGDEYHMATVLHSATYSAWRAGRDADAAAYLQRAVPLVRRLDEPFLWMHSRGAAGYAALLRGDTEAACAGFGEQLRLSRELVFRSVTSFALTGLAAVAALQGPPERAARLAGAAAAHVPADADEIERTTLEARFLTPVRARQGEDAWDAAAREGAAMTLDEAAEYALDELLTKAPALAPTSPGP